jgi:pro-apoptotic serine protease NMA111
VGDASPPRYRAYNHDSLHFDRVAPCLGGVFLDGATGAVGALWASYSFTTAAGDAREMSLGLPAALVADAARPLMAGAAPAIPCLDSELRTLPLSKARTGMGLPPGWVAQLERLGGDRRTVLCVRRCAPRSPASRVLREGDLLLAVAGVPVITFRDVETALARAYASQLQAAATATGGGGAEMTAPAPVPPPPRAVPVTIVRDGVELVVDVAPTLLSGRGTERLLCWAGILLQEAHPPVTDRGFVPDVAAAGGAGGNGVTASDAGATGVASSPPYCSRWSFGSPAHKGESGGGGGGGGFLRRGWRHSASLRPANALHTPAPPFPPTCTPSTQAASAPPTGSWRSMACPRPRWTRCWGWYPRWATAPTRASSASTWRTASACLRCAPTSTIGPQ